MDFGARHGSMDLGARHGLTDLPTWRCGNLKSCLHFRGRFLHSFLLCLENLEFIGLLRSIMSYVEAVTQVLGVPLSLLQADGRGHAAVEGRGVAAYLVRRTPGVSLKELAAFLSRDSSGLSNLATATAQKLATNDTLARSIEEIQRKLQIS